MGAPFEIFSSPARYGDTNNALLLKIWYWISGRGGSGGGLPVVFVPPTWVRHSTLLSASAQIIPAGAIYQYSVLTGTAGDGTMTGLPAGYSDSSATAISAPLTITAAAASTVAVVWFTAT